VFFGGPSGFDQQNPGFLVAPPPASCTIFALPLAGVTLVAPTKQEPGLRPKKAQNTRIRHKSGLCLRVMNKTRAAKFQIGQVVKHRLFPFRGVVFDIDPTFNNTEEWYQSIPAEARPNKDQPFYHLLAENSDSEYIAYVSEQNLLPDNSGEPVRHPQVSEIFKRDRRGNYRLRDTMMH
jgi:heat shock protein HspQ